MSQQNRLRNSIDRMVEDSIRRILPAVMNEVLVATIARGTSDVIREERVVRPRKTPKKRRPIREQRKPPRTAKDRSPARRRVGLEDILDESAGAEFYHDSRAPRDEEVVEVDGPRVAERIHSLPPELRELAEDIDLDDDGGEMWQPGEHDSGEASSMSSGPVGPEIRNIGEAAKRVGIDFSRMKAVIGVTSPKKAIDSRDAKAQAQFEEGRLRRMREKLNDGKPVG